MRLNHNLTALNSSKQKNITIKQVTVDIVNGLGTFDLSVVNINGGYAIPVIYNLNGDVDWKGTSVAIQNAILIVSNSNLYSGKAEIKVFSVL